MEGIPLLPPNWLDDEGLPRKRGDNKGTGKE